MAFDIQGQLDQIVAWCQANWYVLVLVGLVILLLWLYLKKKPKFQSIARAEIERKKFIDREKYNKTELKHLYRGETLYGKIYTLSNHEADEKRWSNIVFRPYMFGIKGIIDFLSKPEALVVSAENSDFSYYDRTFTISEEAIMNKFQGIRYDVTGKANALRYIKDEQISVSDWEQHSDIMLVQGQKSTILRPETAEELVLKEKELQLELAKKRGKQSSI